jgi:hypothetical protein
MGKFIWNNQGLPHKGWSCINVIDTGHATSKCEMCGNSTVRYLHYLEHAEFERQLKVGSECSEKLSENYSTASSVEDYIKRYPKKKAMWSSKWKVSNKGNHYYVEEDCSKDRTVTIFPDKFNPGCFKYLIVDKEYSNVDYGDGPEQELNEDKKFSNKFYATIAEAKEAVFDEFNVAPKELAEKILTLIE